MNAKQMYRFFAAIRICRENIEPIFEDIIESEIKASDSRFQPLIDAQTTKWAHNYKKQKQAEDRICKKRAKERARIRKRYTDFIYTCQGIDDGLTAQNNETLNGITDLFREYLDKNVNIIEVLSLFDGCSGAFMALDDLGYKVTYFRSEIDKFANQAAYLINPNSINLGNVIKLRQAMMWKEDTWQKFKSSTYISKKTKEVCKAIRNTDWSKIDLICAGSPCQGFSFAGKQLAFDDPRSKLFFEFIRIVNHIRNLNPNVKFFLENVDMLKHHMKVINDSLNISGQNINSNLVSAQNRNRWYWTNISTRTVGLFGDIETYIEPPKDRNIFLKDVLQDESEVDEKYYIKNPKFNFSGMDIKGKANTQRTGGSCSQSNKHNFDLIKLDKKLNIKEDQDKVSCYTAGGNSGGNHSDMDVLCVAMRGRNPENTSDRTVGAPTEQRLEPQKDGKTNCITSVSKDNLIIQLPRGNNKGGKHKDKCPTLTSNSFEQNNIVSTINYRLRRLTPKETMNLQTIPERFQKILLESGISNSQLYKMMGNGFTIEAIKEYFKHLKQ